MSAQVHYTVFGRSPADGEMGKVIGLKPDGTLYKTPPRPFWRGTFRTVKVEASATAVVEGLRAFTPYEALSPSLCLTADEGRITTEKLKDQYPGAIVRGASTFGYRPDVPGLLTLDYDPPNNTEPLSPDELRSRLLTVWPELSRGIMVHGLSASSLLYHPDGHQLSGVAGQRVYIALKRQSDIPEAIERINALAWLHGIGGHIQVAENGALLPRGLFDAAMGDKGGRFDYAPSGVVSRDGVTSRRSDLEVWFDGKPIDLLPELTSAQQAEVAAIIERAKQDAKPAADAARVTWRAAREHDAVVEALKAGADPAEAKEQIRREIEAMQGDVLPGSFRLFYKESDGSEKSVTVGEMLLDPKRWHGVSFLSPHSPSHRNRSADAIAWTLQQTPILHDLNGPVTYRLQRQPAIFQKTDGNLSTLADQVATELATYPDLLVVAGHLVTVKGGGFTPVEPAMIAFLIGTRCSFWKYKANGSRTNVDPDDKLVSMVASLLRHRLVPIQSISTIPLIDAEGRLIAALGLDRSSGIFIQCARDRPEPNATPSRAEVVTALRRAWQPLSLSLWASPHDAASVLATLLTIVTRQTITHAPGLFADSALAGSGKSSLIGAIMMLVQGSRAHMTPWAGDSEVELAKLLISLAKAGVPVAAFDNCTGVTNSNVISSATIEGRVSGRNLGGNVLASYDFRAMWLFSGNQGMPGRDCATRLMMARIACPDGRPHMATFPFEPSQAALSDREGIIDSLILIHRAWHAAGRPKSDGDTTRFVEWSFVRWITTWLRESGIAAEAGLPELGDPAFSIRERVNDVDPTAERRGALFDALETVYGREPISAADVARQARFGKENGSAAQLAIYDAVMAHFPRQHNIPAPQSISTMFRNQRDIAAIGLRLVEMKKGNSREEQRSGVRFMLIDALEGS